LQKKKLQKKQIISTNSIDDRIKNIQELKKKYNLTSTLDSKTPEISLEEIEGLMEALVRFSLNEGLIITENEEYVENIQMGDKSFKITVIPIWKWLL